MRLSNSKPRRSLRVLTFVGLSFVIQSSVLFTGICSAAEPDARQLATNYQSEIRPLVERYCTDCHGGAGVSEGDIDLAVAGADGAAAHDIKTWQKAAEMLRNGLMPPQDADQPKDDERRQLENWIGAVLEREARAHAGDPGRVLLRRLSNAEYTYTIRDLTGVESLEPAREFPVDGAAGEGFTNTGNSLVMSPALLTKYMDAAKGIAAHAVLLPDGFRFSPHTTARDWTDDTLAEIRAFYRGYTEAGGGSTVNLQGIVFDTNQGGRLPIEKYLEATVVERDALMAGQRTVTDVARERKLNAKYLGLLWNSLNAKPSSLVMDGLRARWRTAKPEDVAALAANIVDWQHSLWKFSSVGLIGRTDGPKQWMEPVAPLATKQDFKFKIPEAVDGSEVVISLVASNAGDGPDADNVVWQAPRLVAPGRADLRMRDVHEFVRQSNERRSQIFAETEAYLSLVDELSSSTAAVDVGKAAKDRGLDETTLRAWLDYLGLSVGEAAEIGGLFTNQLRKVGSSDVIAGWGSDDTPSIVANSSGDAVRIPGNVQPHSVAVHPSSTLRSAVGWRSPITGRINIAGSVTPAHSECGNGVSWSLSVRRGKARQQLADGITQGANKVDAPPVDGVLVHAGDVVCLSIGPRDKNHSCDLTTIALEITGAADATDQKWNLADDVSGSILAGNPHADRHENHDVWHFFSEPDAVAANAPVIPSGSLLAKWVSATTSGERKAIAVELRKLLTSQAPTAKDSPNAILYGQLASLHGPLLATFSPATAKLTSAKADGPQNSSHEVHTYGLDPSIFGHRPDGSAISESDLTVEAPSVIEVHLPAELAAGAELVTSATLDDLSGREGSVQVAIASGKSKATSELIVGTNSRAKRQGTWSDGAVPVTSSSPVITAAKSDAERRFNAAFDEFRELFPPALCYTKIVPVDEAISVTLFYREDDHLSRLMLSETERAQLDRLWDELHFVSGDALSSVDAFAQLLEFATQDADPKVFEPLRKPINDRADAYRQQLVDCEPIQLAALFDFAGRAYRRPLTKAESRGLRSLYNGLRREGMLHEEAFRLTLARILVGPAFLYRVESAVEGKGQGPVTDWELATRLSYFLWSSQPDNELRRLAAAGQLHDKYTLIAQTHRMLRNDRAHRLATEFACHWLQIDDFANLDEKSDRHFPEFKDLRASMAEESTRFFTDLFQRNGSVLDILDADYTFVNGRLAAYYGIPGVEGDEWRRVDGIKKYWRGGVLGQATTLTKQSGASRTSPILRGNWISEVLLGERLPKPPKGVPPLPDDEAATEGLTVRQLVEKHVSDPKCSVCHRRIDPYGFSLEEFDAIGRHRDHDLAKRPVDCAVRTLDGAEFAGLDGLRNYLLTKRRDAFVRQFCRKLLGYSLGRSVQLSDEPLLYEMASELATHEYKIGAAVDLIVLSPQFREIRGIDNPANKDE